MDPHALAVLEWPKLRDLLAREAASALGLEAAARLAPLPDPAAIRQWHARITEARRLFDQGDDLPLGGLHDLRPALGQCRIGGALDTRDLRSVAETLRCVATLRRALHEKHHLPLLRDLALRLTELPHLIDEIERCITEDLDVADAASAELRRLRQLGRTLAARVQTSLRRILGNLSTDLAVQEAVVTVRDGRYCIPVKTSHQGRLDGIVHDRSSSGQTVFMEPAEVVRLGNELREAEAAERDEVARILAALSSQVAAEVESIAGDLALLTTFDEIRSRGRLALRLVATEPVLDESGVCDLRAARHPLLAANATAARPVVPNHLRLGGECRTVLVTGPNTGGKTVALKTLGLLTLMAHAGLHIPAEAGSRVALVPDVFADIGDEQSLEQSLSTFGSHLRQIVGILAGAQPGSLVLLDEIGAGTDPVEGAALAQAVLSALHERGCLVMATTHHGSLKAFAYDTPGVENASVEFDAGSLGPTYRLLIGIPGASHAFEIAEGLGLPAEVLAAARELLPTEHVEAADLIHEMQASRSRLERELRDREREAANASHQRRELERERQRLRELELELREAASKQAAEKLTQVEREAGNILAELRRAQHEGQRTEAARQKLKRLANRIVEPTLASAVPTKAPPSVAIGDRVRVVPLAREGDVVGIDSAGKVTLQIGRARLVAQLHELELVSSVRPNVEPSVSKRAKGGALSVDLEVHLRGMTVEDALDKLDRYLDQALLGNLETVRIVHGKGTGTLKRVVHEYLRHHPHIGSYGHPEEFAGGTGVTVAKFR